MAASRVTSFFGAILSAALMVLSLWAWQAGPHVAFDADRPELALWAVRTASIAAAALAQGVILFMVVGNIYRPRALDVILRVLATAIFLIALVGAVALVVAQRR